MHVDQIGERVGVEADVVVVGEQPFEVPFRPATGLDHRGLAQVERIDALDRHLGDDADRSDPADGSPEQFVVRSDRVHGAGSVDEPKGDDLVAEVGRPASGPVHIGRKDPGHALRVVGGEGTEGEPLREQGRREIAQTSTGPHGRLLRLVVDVDHSRQRIE